MYLLYILRCVLFNEFCSFSSNSERGPPCSRPACTLTHRRCTYLDVFRRLPLDELSYGDLPVPDLPVLSPTDAALTWMYLGASFSTNSAMGTSLFQTCQYSRPWSLYFSRVVLVRLRDPPDFHLFRVVVEHLVLRVTCALHPTHFTVEIPLPLTKANANVVSGSFTCSVVL